MAKLQPIIVFYSRHFVRHLGICNKDFFQLPQLMSGVITQNSVKNKVLILINCRVTSNDSVSRRHCVRHLAICNPICIKLLQAMSGVIPRNLKNRRLDLKLFSWRPQTRHTHSYTDTHTHTHTHTHMSIAIGEMQCVAFRLKLK